VRKLSARPRPRAGRPAFTSSSGSDRSDPRRVGKGRLCRPAPAPRPVRLELGGGRNKVACRRSGR
jgi:hypothetical protein